MSAGVVSRVFVGRGAEFGVLTTALAGAERERPATILLGGDAGVGKSRLAREFSAQVAAGARVLTGTCVDLGADGLPFAPFTAALRELVGDLGADTVRKLLPGGVPGELAGLLPGLGNYQAGADAGAARVRLFEQVLGLLGRLSADRPLVLIIEDAHWADRSSRDLLDFLVRNQQSLPALLIVVTYRAEDVPRAHPLRTLLAELSRLDWVIRLDLAPLSKRDVVAQMRSILDREPEPELVEVIYRRSEGNPLFVETLLERGEPTALPASLGDLLLDRIDRLGAETRRVVRAAAVGGARVGHALLVAVTGLDDAALSEAIRPAVDANVLTVDGDCYAFRHALIREAAYAGLLPGERIPLHARYADTLAGEPSLAPGARAATELAHHRLATGESGAALVAAHQAADEAKASLAYAEQLRMLERVVRLWPAVPDAAERIDADRLSIMERAVEAAHLAGDYPRGVELATAALGELDRTAEPVRAGLLLELRGRMRRHIGHADDVADLRAAVEVVPAGHPIRAVMLNSVATRMMEAPFPDEARAAAEEALAIARRTGDERSEAAALVSLSTLDARRGGLEDQLPRLVAARAMAERNGAHNVVMQSLQWESSLLLAYGESERAAEVARRAMARVQAMGVARAYGAVHAIDLVGAVFTLGRWDEAVDVIEHAMDLAPPPSYQVHLLCIRGLIALYRGDLALPEDAVARSHRLLAGAAGFAQDPLRLPRLEIQLRVAQGRHADALDVVDWALALPYLPKMPRFAWMLVTNAAGAVAQARAAGELAERATAVLATVRSVAATLGVHTPVQEADRLTYLAELALAEGTHDRGAWEAAVEAWDSLRRPYRAAEVLVPAAEAAIVSGDREAATGFLRRAAELTDRLGAALLRGELDDLARRARIVVGPDTASDGSDPADAVRRRLGLTPREIEILRLVSAGRGNREIAEELFISAKTASVHVSNIIAKLGVANRVEAAATAHRLGLAGVP